MYIEGCQAQLSAMLEPLTRVGETVWKRMFVVGGGGVRAFGDLALSASTVALVRSVHR